MLRDARRYLYDVLAATEGIRAFTAGGTLAAYLDDLMLRSACERQFTIIGEAMARLRDEHPEVFDEIEHGSVIIAFRNRLIHEYETVDHELVWDVITHEIADLELRVRSLLDELR